MKSLIKLLFTVLLLSACSSYKSNPLNHMYVTNTQTPDHQVTGITLYEKISMDNNPRYKSRINGIASVKLFIDGREVHQFSRNGSDFSGNRDYSNKIGFLALPPGEHLLTVTGKTLLSFFYNELEERVITISPGEKKNVVLPLVWVRAKDIKAPLNLFSYYPRLDVN